MTPVSLGQLVNHHPTTPISLACLVNQCQTMPISLPHLIARYQMLTSPTHPLNRRPTTPMSLTCLQNLQHHTMTASMSTLLVKRETLGGEGRINSTVRRSAHRRTKRCHMPGRLFVGMGIKG